MVSAVVAETAAMVATTDANTNNSTSEVERNTKNTSNGMSRATPNAINATVKALSNNQSEEEETTTNTKGIRENDATNEAVTLTEGMSATSRMGMKVGAVNGVATTTTEKRITAEEGYNTNRDVEETSMEAATATYEIVTKTDMVNGAAINAADEKDTTKEGDDKIQQEETDNKDQRVLNSTTSEEEAKITATRNKNYYNGSNSDNFGKAATMAETTIVMHKETTKTNEATDREGIQIEEKENGTCSSKRQKQGKESAAGTKKKYSTQPAKETQKNKKEI